MDLKMKGILPYRRHPFCAKITYRWVMSKIPQIAMMMSYKSSLILLSIYVLVENSD